MRKNLQHAYVRLGEDCPVPDDAGVFYVEEGADQGLHIWWFDWVAEDD